MERKSSIIALAEELERLKQSSVDIVAHTKDIKAVAVPHQGPNAVRLTGIVNYDNYAKSQEENSKQLELQVEGHKPYPLTRHGSLQLADKCGIPRKYYEAMLQAGMVDLTAQNVNSWLSKQADRRLVRVADGHVRALLSDRYRVLDNYDLAMLTMERAKEHNATIQESSLTETRMYVKLVVPGYREALQAGDDVVPGLMVSNSEVGDGAFRVEPFLFRLVCKNGLIGTESLYKVHLGQRMELGELIYKDDTRRALDNALWSQVRDIIDSTFNPEVLRAFIGKLRSAKDIPIEKPTEVVDVQAQDLQLSDTAKLDLLRYFAKEGDTLFGLVSGITRLAQDYENYDERVRLERHAGELLEAKIAP